MPFRWRLLDDRNEIGRKFRVGEYGGYILHVGVPSTTAPRATSLRRHREGRHHARRPDEPSFMDVRPARAPVRRAARGVRLEVRPHALRAVGRRRTTPTSATAARSSTTSSAGWARSSSRSTSRRRSASSSQEVRACLSAGLRRRRSDGSWSSSFLALRGPDRALQHPRGCDRVLPLWRLWSAPATATPAATAGRRPAAAEPDWSWTRLRSGPPPLSPSSPSPLTTTSLHPFLPFPSHPSPDLHPNHDFIPRPPIALLRTSRLITHRPPLPYPPSSS